MIDIYFSDLIEKKQLEIAQAMGYNSIDECIVNNDFNLPIANLIVGDDDV